VGPEARDVVPGFRAILIVPCAAALVVAVGAAQPTPGEGDPFAFFRPLLTVSSADRQRIDRGEVLARILPGRDGEVAVFAATRLNADPDVLARWTHAIESFKKGPFVLAIRRFSTPPVLSDLDDLTLDEGDLEGMRRCRSGDCSVKLTAQEIQALRVVMSAAGSDWKTAAQQEFKRLLLERLSRFSAEGIEGLSPYVDHSEPTLPRDVLAGILERSPHLRMHLPLVTDGLARFPKATLPATESFMYWSKERYGTGKAVIAVTQVHITRPTGPSLPAIVVLGQELFASHYRDGSLGTSFVVSAGEQGYYLVYVNRSRVDVLGGFFGGLKRNLIEGRLGNEVKTAVETVRKRLEGGNPS